MIPGRAPLFELRPPACRTSLLQPGYPVAPAGYRLWLLPPGPDQVHGPTPHRTQPSTPLSQAVPADVEPSGGEFDPAIAVFGFRAPLPPRLARPGTLYRMSGEAASGTAPRNKTQDTRSKMQDTRRTAQETGYKAQAAGPSRLGSLQLVSCCLPLVAIGGEGGI